MNNFNTLRPRHTRWKEISRNIQTSQPIPTDKFDQHLEHDIKYACYPFIIDYLHEHLVAVLSRNDGPQFTISYLRKPESLFDALYAICADYGNKFYNAERNILAHMLQEGKKGALTEELSRALTLLYKKRLKLKGTKVLDRTFLSAKERRSEFDIPSSSDLFRFLPQIALLYLSTHSTKQLTKSTLLTAETLADAERLLTSSDFKRILIQFILLDNTVTNTLFQASKAQTPFVSAENEDKQYYGMELPKEMLVVANGHSQINKNFIEALKEVIVNDAELFQEVNKTAHRKVVRGCPFLASKQYGTFLEAIIPEIISQLRLLQNTTTESAAD
jgi:hypothetical protein